ncbi:MAG: hypothetical protein JNJ50_26915 [Acidobacteria bacterium]|nr:hypothetical protein [Acidobacteriota bacterium]
MGDPVNYLDTAGTDIQCWGSFLIEDGIITAFFGISFCIAEPELDSVPSPVIVNGGSGQANPQSALANFWQVRPGCFEYLNHIALVNGRQVTDREGSIANFILVDSNRPEWTQRLVDLGYPANWLSEEGYNPNMTLGEYLSQPNRVLLAVAIPDRGNVYLGPNYNNNLDVKNLFGTPVHELLHIMFGSHYSIATMLGVATPSEIDQAKLSEKDLSDNIDEWLFDQCGEGAFQAPN